MAAEGKLYTLTEVSKKTKISMPTLQRYKKLYQDRIPSQGEGRTQRYPQAALAVFKELKKENIGRRGRPRKNADAPKPPAKKRGRPPKKKSAAKSSGAGEQLLTLTEISKRTKISYPTLLRYVKTHLKGIPHRGSGRGRRYLPEAIDVFQKLRESSRRGRKKGSGPKAKPVGRPAARGRKAASSGDLAGRVKELEKAHKQLARQLNKLEKQLNKPLKVMLTR